MGGRTLAIVPAAGTGRRMAAEMPKQYLSLAGVPIIVRTLQALNNSPVIDEIYLVTPPGDQEGVRSVISGAGGFEKLTQMIPGGSTRQESTRNAVAVSREEHDILLIHDAVRPFVTDDLLGKVVQGARQYGAAIAAVEVRETVKRREAERLLTTVDRENLWLAQTPQAFRRDLLFRAHQEALAKSIAATDDSALVEMIGVGVELVTGSYDNIKITTPEDLIWGELLARRFQR